MFHSPGQDDVRGMIYPSSGTSTVRGHIAHFFPFFSPFLVSRLIDAHSQLPPFIVLLQRFRLFLHLARQVVLEAAINPFPPFPSNKDTTSPSGRGEIEIRRDFRLVRLQIGGHD